MGRDSSLTSLIQNDAYRRFVLLKERMRRDSSLARLVQNDTYSRFVIAKERMGKDSSLARLVQNDIALSFRAKRGISLKIYVILKPFSA